jgi:hypothetical protein
MSLTKFYKFVTPETHLAKIHDNSPQGQGGLYGNYTWYHSLVYGSAQRLSRYKEYDAMDLDTDVSVALDLIAGEIVGKTSKNDIPLNLTIEAGNEQYVNPTMVVTVKAALRTWCKVEDWSVRLFPLARNVIKYGDCFFIRNNREKFRRSIFVSPRNVTGALVNELDHTDIKAWQIQYRFLGGVNSTFNQNGYKTITNPLMSDNTNDFSSFNEIKAEDVIWYSLYNDMADEAPFGVSILRAIYKVFKQKELLEDAIIIYRIQRAPEKRMFRIDVGNMPPNLRASHLEQLRNEVKQKRIPSNIGGATQVDSIYNSQTMNEDYYFTKNAAGEGSTVEILPGGQNLGEIQDLDYFYNKMWRGLRIPQSYMNANVESGPASDGKVGIAYQQEINFTVYIERLQKALEHRLDDEFKKFLERAGIKVDTTMFRITLPPPSNYMKSRENAINNDLLGTYQMADGIEALSKRFAQVKYLGLTVEEVAINERQKREEMGLNPNGGMKDLPMIYNPEAAERGGFDGGLAGSKGQIGDDMLPAGGDDDKGGPPGEGGDEGGQPGEGASPADNGNAPPPPKK